MSYQHIKFAIEEGIAHLVLARDDVRNAFSGSAFIDEIVDAVNRAQLGADVRVLVLSAEGSAFSAGGNIKDMRDRKGTFAGGPASVRRGYIEGIQRIPKALHALDIPSIAAVQGPAIGAGCDLALYCDVPQCHVVDQRIVFRHGTAVFQLHIAAGMIYAVVYGGPPATGFC